MGMKIKKRMVLIFTLSLVLVVGLVVNSNSDEVVSANYTKIEKKIEKNASKVKTEYGLSIEVINEKIKKSYRINPTSNGEKAVVMNEYGNGFAIVNNKGEVVDNLYELFEKMESKKSKKPIADDPEFDTNKQVGDYITAGHIYKDKKLLFVSNYDTIHGSIWSMDLDTKETKKLLDANDYGNVSILYVSDSNVLFYSSAKKAVLEMDLNLPSNLVKEHYVNGHILNVSNDGNIVTYQVYDADKNLENYIGFYNISTNSTVELIEMDEGIFYNNGGVWSEDSSTFAFVAHRLNSEENLLLIYNIRANEMLEINEAENSFNTDDDSIEFIDTNIIQAKLANNEIVQYNLGN